jgi:hypothetical protein
VSGTLDAGEGQSVEEVEVDDDGLALGLGLSVDLVERGAGGVEAGVAGALGVGGHDGLILLESWRLGWLEIEM